MPFMKGTAPVRRTKEFLNAGKLIFRPQIRIMTINYNIDQKASEGAYEFLFWHLPQIKFKNKNLQILKFKNMTPTPFIQLLFIDGKKELVDVYGRSRREIHNHLLETFCIPEKIDPEEEKNPGLFGLNCGRWCICEVSGQVPCPGFVPLPKEMRGKFIYGKTQE